MKKAALFIVMILLLMMGILWSCSNEKGNMASSEDRNTYPESGTEISSNAELREESKPLDMKVSINQSGKAVFKIFIADFIKSFNEIYEKSHDSEYLTALNEWAKLDGISPCFGYTSTQYRFSSDDEIWSRPTISVFMPEDGDGVYEIELTFDDHAYQENQYEEFTELCLCTLFAVLPELDDREINSLYEKLYEQTEKSYWKNDNNIPRFSEIYCSDSIGFYGYYGEGTVNICIIPITEDVDGWFRENGIRKNFI